MIQLQSFNLQSMEKKIAMAGAMLLSKGPLEANPALENVENVPPESDSRQGPPQTQTEFPVFSTQRPSATVTSGAYQALTSATDESFTEPSYVVVNNEPVKQFPTTGVLAETSLNSTGSVQY